MSRTYKKNVKVGIAGGTNTEFYRSRDRKIRRKNREICRGMVDNEDRDLAVMNDKYIKNDWEEPTDGSYVYNEETLKQNARENNSGMLTKFQSKIARYIKSMRPWNRSKTA